MDLSWGHALDRAKVGYEAYGEYVSWQTFDGQQMPTWDGLSDRTRNAWAACALAIEDDVTHD